jgi:hypothetical protein
MNIKWKKDNMDLKGRKVKKFDRSMNGKGKENEYVMLMEKIYESDEGR